MACDSQTTWGNNKTLSLTEEKIIKVRDDFIIGISGSCRMGFFFKEYCRRDIYNFRDKEKIGITEVVDFFKYFNTWITTYYKGCTGDNNKNKLEEISILFILNKKLFALVDNYPK